MTIVEEPVKLTARWVTWLIINRSKFQPRRMLMIPNLSWSFLHWEADLVAITDAGFMTEIEIKVTKTDLLKDQEKDKFKHRRSGLWKSSWDYIKEFYYCVPESLIKEVPVSYLEYAGILAVQDNGKGRVRIVYPAPRNNKALKVSPEDRLNLMRILGLRFWSNYKIIK